METLKQQIDTARANKIKAVKAMNFELAQSYREMEKQLIAAMEQMETVINFSI